MTLVFIYFTVILLLCGWKNYFGLAHKFPFGKYHLHLGLVIKLIGVFGFFYVFEKILSDNKNYDARVYFNDAYLLHQLVFEDPLEYIKILFGFQNDQHLSKVAQDYINQTTNWDEGMSWRIIFNDNRTVIRFHSVVHLFSNNNIYVHGLFSSLFGFIGLLIIYTSFIKEKSKLNLLTYYSMLLFPNLWFFTSGILKEPLLIFNISLVILLTKYLVNTVGVLKKLLALIFIIGLCLSLKFAITFMFFLLFFIYLMVQTRIQNYKSVSIVVLCFICMLIFGVLFVIGNKTSVIAFMNKKQTEFKDQMAGGIFLKDHTKFVRLKYNWNNVLKDSDTSYKIKKGTEYVYWNDNNQKDTLFCNSNIDDTTRYKLIYVIEPANTGYQIHRINGFSDFFSAAIKAIGMTTLFPLKWNGLLNIVVSIENILITLIIGICLIGLYYNKSRALITVILIFTFLFLYIIGFSTPNTGAIIRYRIILIPFLLIGLNSVLKEYYESKRIR